MMVMMKKKMEIAIIISRTVAITRFYAPEHRNRRRHLM